jgi:hypothetical protein
MATLDNMLKTAVRIGMESAFSDNLQELVAIETRRALRDHEEQLTELVRNAVSEAINELFNGRV